MALTNRTNSEYDLSDELRKQYAANTEAELAGLKSAYTKNLAAIDNTAKNIPALYDEARRNVAAQGDIAQRNFNERAVATGLNTGTSGQAALALGAQTRGQIVQLDREQATAIADADLQRANLQAEYEAAMAQARAKNNAALAGALYDEMARVQNIEAKMAGGGSGGNGKKPDNETYKTLNAQLKDIDTKAGKYSEANAKNIVSNIIGNYNNGYITYEQKEDLLGKAYAKEDEWIRSGLNFIHGYYNK